VLLRLLVLVLSLGLPRVPADGAAAAPAGDPLQPGAQAAASRPDTVVRADLGRPPRAVAAGLAADEGAPHARLGLRRIPVTSGGVLAPVAPPLLFGQAPGEVWAARLARQADPEALLAGVLRTRVAEWGRSSADTAFFLPAATAAPSPSEAAVGAELPRFVTDFADLALRVRSRMELGGDWSRYTPCDPQLKISCTPTLIPQLSPDVQFGVQVAGSILDRVAVDVDFDQAREYDAANRINIVYNGAPDDILRRLEVGM
jgi:hypothetical protein